MSGDERKFLHDISSPLMVAMGMSEAVITVLKEQGVEEKQIDRLEKGYKAMERLADKIAERRQILIDSEKVA